MKTCIYPGSFDPITLGHLDVIRRAASIFDKVVVVVMINAEKKTLFTLEERRDLIARVTRDIPNVSVSFSDDLLSRYADTLGDCVVVKGLRAISDFEAEFQQALINRKLNPKLETVFLPTSEEYLYLSSSVVKNVGYLKGDISNFVPSEILPIVSKKLCEGN
ncbi:MAG: pantetheine-phosphate adenylyltransferase [Clostridia bacterium]|nr:pantetheine-phosphate adenylyltransferase [Clostridia bacterium]